MNIILIIALFVGGGASLAAEGSLPGNFLYPVKVGVNENIRSWVAVSNKAQANWDARRAERRIKETEELAVRGRLSAETSADLEGRFESHAEAFKDLIAKLEAQGNASAAVEATSDFEASLRAHEQVLARIAAERAEARERISSISSKVRTTATAVAALRTAAEARLSAEAGADIQVAAEGRLRAAKSKIAEVRSLLSRVRSSVNASVSANAEARLSSADAAVARGEASMSASAYAEAYARFQEAIRLAQEAQLTLSIDEIFDIDVDISSGSNSSTSTDSSGSTNVDANADGIVDVQY